MAIPHPPGGPWRPTHQGNAALYPCPELGRLCRWCCPGDRGGLDLIRGDLLYCDDPEVVESVCLLLAYLAAYSEDPATAVVGARAGMRWARHLP